LSTDSYPNMSSLNHAYVIGSITNAQGDPLSIIFNECRDLHNRKKVAQLSKHKQSLIIPIL
jgi:hypothetical protein